MVRPPVGIPAGLAACLSISMSFLAIAAPNITAVSGPLQDGATLIVSGSGFGAKTPAQPYLWVTFEHGPEPIAEPISLGQVEVTSGEFSPSAASPQNQWSWRGAPGIPSNPGQGTNVAVGTDLTARYPTGVDRVYLFVRRKYTGSGWWAANLNYRLFRLWAGSCRRYGQPDLTLGLLGDHLRLSTGSAGPAIPVGTRVPPTNEWIREEYQAFAGTPGRRDARLVAWWDGAMVVKTDLVGRVTAASEGWGCARIENLEIEGPLTGRDAYVYLDDLYVDTTFARVMLCTSPAWEACTDREPQLPLAWADGSITIQVAAGALADLAHAYLYVVSPSGEVNAAGFSLGASWAATSERRSIEPPVPPHPRSPASSRPSVLRRSGPSPTRTRAT